MRYIAMYSEFGFQDAPSMRDSFEKTAYSGQKRIAAYLRNGTPGVACPKTEKDVFTGEFIRDESVVRSDGTYMWPMKLAYYVEQYNLRLPAVVGKHILSKKTVFFDPIPHRRTEQ